MDIKVFIVGYEIECEKAFFCKTGGSSEWLATGMSHEFQSPDNWNVQTIFFYPIVLQLSWPFNFLHASHVWHFGESSVARYSEVPIARMLLIAHTLEFFTLSHTQPLHDFHLNTRFLIAKLQANLAQNKTNTWLNKFNLIESVLFGDFVFDWFIDLIVGKKMLRSMFRACCSILTKLS